MKVRLMGTVAECSAVAAALDDSPWLSVVEVSNPVLNRGQSRLVRVYVEVRLAQGGGRDDRRG